MYGYDEFDNYTKIGMHVMSLFYLNPTVLPLDHGRNESYPLMNNETGKCLDADSNYARTIEVDCNLSTTKRWKLLNNGKQLCDENSAECLSGEVSDDPRLGPVYIPWPSLFPMLGDESGKKNCTNCWVPNKKTQHVSASNNQIRLIYGKSFRCLVTDKAPHPFLKSTIRVYPCGGSYKDQIWFFVSFE